MNILITGSNRGFGLELCRVALAAGHTVIAGMRQTAELSADVKALQAKYPATYMVEQLDVNDEDSVKACANRLQAAEQQLDAIVNNAAVLIDRGYDLEQLDFAKVEETFKTNLFGPMKVMKHFLPLITQTTDGAIINISSEAGCFANAYGGDYSYALSKSALTLFTLQLKRKLAKYPIRVLAVHPGWMRTDMGGANAVTDPADQAQQCMQLITGETAAEEGHYLVRVDGSAMPF